MKLISPDTNKCIKCHACSEVCPMHIIELDLSGFPLVQQGAYLFCINCGYCVDICAVDALNHRVRKRSTDNRAAMKRYRVLQENKKNKNVEDR